MNVIVERIEKDLTQAMKDGDKTRLMTMRMLRSALKNAEIAKKPEKFEESDCIKVIRGELKKRMESSEEYTKGNRQELADAELAEAKILKEYLPEELSDEKIIAIVQDVKKKTGASGMSDFGKLMGAVMKEVGGAADGKRVGEILKKNLK